MPLRGRQPSPNKFEFAALFLLELRFASFQPCSEATKAFPESE
jgi:hypothetical protein